MAFRIIVYASALVLAGASSFLYIRSKKKSQSLIKKQILNRESYKAFTHAIRVAYTANYWPELKKSREERRKLQARSAEYEKCVSNFQKKMKVLLNDATKKAIKDFGISEKIFEESVNYFDNDSELREYGEKLVQPLTQEPGILLSKEEVRKILNFFSSRAKENESECLDLDEYIVSNSQIEDEIFRTYKLEIEDVNFAFEKYKNDLEEIVEPLKNQTSYILASSEDAYDQ